MFDIGFWELAIIGVVALLVIGPERLPSVAKSVGHWVGKAKQFVSYVQSDIKTEINKADELKQLLQEQAQIKEVHEIIEQAVTDTKQGVSVGAQLSNHTVKSFDELEEQSNPDSSPLNSSSNPDAAAVSSASAHDKKVTKTLNE